MEDLATREHDHAVRMLSHADVTDADFERVVLAFDFDEAGLVDAQGRLLAIWPESPDLIGEPFADRYAHIATALSGRTGVSAVAASAEASSPVIAVAVPFETPSGRRVLSGGFRPDTGPLGIYFDSISAVGDRTYLVDDTGNIVVTAQSSLTSDVVETLTPERLARLDRSVGTLEAQAGMLTYVREAVEGTPWHNILTTSGNSGTGSDALGCGVMKQCSSSSSRSPIAWTTTDPKTSSTTRFSPGSGGDGDT